MAFLVPVSNLPLHLHVLQAQTVANFYLAFEQDLAIVPVLNKIDLPGAEPQRVAQQLLEVFDVPPEDCLHISAKTGGRASWLTLSVGQAWELALQPSWGAIAGLASWEACVPGVT